MCLRNLSLGLHKSPQWTKWGGRAAAEHPPPLEMGAPSPLPCLRPQDPAQFSKGLSSHPLLTPPRQSRRQSGPCLCGVRSIWNPLGKQTRIVYTADLAFIFHCVSVETSVNQMWFSADMTSKAVNTLISKLQNTRQPATVKVTDK